MRPPTPGAPPVERLSDQVAARLQELIRSGAFRPGEKLPSERDLCEALSVSRTVVREGVRSLVARGLLEVRHGGGTIVRTPDAALVSEMMTMLLQSGSDVSFTHVQEIRRLLEVEIAGLAAERQTPADLQRMLAELEAMQAASDDPEAWARADVAFHAAIALATHNPLYPVLLSSIADLLIEVRRTGIRLPDTPARAYRHHQAIYTAIADGNRAAARQAMQAHLRESDQTLRQARLRAP